MQKRGDSMIYTKRCPACRSKFDVDSDKKTVTCPVCNEELTLEIPTSEHRKSMYLGGFCLKYVPSEITCTICGETKPISEFKVDTNQSTYHQQHCKDCSNEQYRIYYDSYKYRRLKKDTISKIPEINSRAPLSSVLNHLIKISKRKYNTEQILNYSINKIKETITGEIEA